MVGLEKDFLDLLSHAVVVERFLGKDAVGNKEYGLPEEHVAFIEEQNVNFAASDTQNRQRSGPSTGSRIIMDAIYIDVGDRITLPSGKVTYVTGAQMLRDEDEDVMQNVDVATEQEN